MKLSFSDTYEGEWLAENRDGYGILTNYKEVYEGEFVKNLKHGKGKWKGSEG